MANLNENAVWENGVYQIETADPVLGGPEGISNVQAKQLANRTRYLKARADLVDEAKGSHGSLVDRMNSVEQATEALGPEAQDDVNAALGHAINLAGLAVSGVRALHQFAQQEGVLTIANRGVVSGCAITRSTTAARNLHISAGKCFARGRSFGVVSGENVASVPSNVGTGAQTVYAYLYENAGGQWRLAVTSIGQAVPADCITLYKLTVPAGSTDATDADLSGVTITDVRRIESSFPVMLDNAVQITPAITPLPDAAYHVSFDLLSSAGAPTDASSLVVVSRASNGFTVRLAAAVDNVTARWRISRLNA